eukprot:1143818-Pelagomonas_calceolata.AAC.7
MLAYKAKAKLLELKRGLMPHNPKPCVSMQKLGTSVCTGAHTRRWLAILSLLIFSSALTALCPTASAWESNLHMDRTELLLFFSASTALMSCGCEMAQLCSAAAAAAVCV